MKFKSHTHELKYIILILPLLGLFIYYKIYLEFQQIPMLSEGLAFIGLLMVVVYFYYGLTNYDFTITNENMVIENRFFLFRKRYSIELEKIKLIRIKDDSIINMFSEYKYIIIQIDDESGVKNLKFHCHGLEYDCNGDNDNLPTFDNFYDYLKKHNIKAEWINRHIKNI